MGRMGVIQTNLGDIGILSAGRGDATPILFLHGVGSDKSVWQPQLEHYGSTRPAHAFDYPGYGESELVANASRDDFASAILAAMDALDIDAAHICGLSLGGVIAIAMHALAPQRCASLILADTFAIHPDGQAIYDRSVAASEDIGMRALAEGRVDALIDADCSDEVRSEVIETMSRIDPKAYVIGAEAVWLADQRDRAARIDVPTLIPVGAEDRITPPALSEGLSGLVPGSRIVVIPKAGHLSNLEQPVAFNAAVDSFLAEVEA